MLFATVVATIHVVLYVTTTGSPFDHGAPAWEGFWDQSQYVRSAVAFAQGNFAPSEHWYALGYPLLGGPFVSVVPKDPFFVINSVSIVVFAVAFVGYFRPIIGSIPSMGVFLAAHLLPVGIDAPHRVNVPVWLQYLIPWNTIPVAALLMVILVRLRGLRDDDSVLEDAALGTLAGVVVTVRPSDVLPLLVAGAFYLRHRASCDRSVSRVGVAVMAAAIVSSLYAALSWSIYGGLATPYHQAVRDIGASMSDLHERAYAILIDASVTHEEPTAALAVMQPWLILAMPLAAAWAAIDIRRGLLVVGAAAISLLSYISYNDFWPYAFVRLSLMHYVVWTLPILTAAGVAGAMAIAREKRWVVLATVFASAALLASLRVVAVPITPRDVSIEPLPNGYTRYEIALDRAQEIDAIDFRGATTADPRGVTLKAFDVTEDGRPLAVMSGYRPIQLRDGLRIGFNRHVDAARVSATLDNTIKDHPAESMRVRALRFTLTFGR